MVAYTKLEKLCQGFPLLDDKDKMFILGIVEGLVFVKQKTGKPETGWGDELIEHR